MGWQLRLSDWPAPAQPSWITRTPSRAAPAVVGKVTVTGETEVPASPSDDVVEVVSRLIRFDTTNTGEPETTQGEAECAQWVAERLAEVGYQPEYVESGAPGRGNVFARLAGADSSRGALLVHGHLDVVGMMIVVARQLKRAGIVPPRDLVFAFVADEEHGGGYGSHWLVDNRPDLFGGITEAIGEVGGFSLTVPRPDGSQRRLYLIETAEKGIQWMRLTARGRAGHGSMVNDQNAVTVLAEAVARLGRHQFPLVVTDTESADLEGTIEKLGPMARMLNAVLRDTANPTMLKAGYKSNVIPATAEAVVDCRV